MHINDTKTNVKFVKYHITKSEAPYKLEKTNKKIKNLK